MRLCTFCTNLNSKTYVERKRTSFSSLQKYRPISEISAKMSKYRTHCRNQPRKRSNHVTTNKMNAFFAIFPQKTSKVSKSKVSPSYRKRTKMRRNTSLSNPAVGYARDSHGDPPSVRSSSEHSGPCSRASSVLYPGQASLLCASLLLPVTPEFVDGRQSPNLLSLRPYK